MKLLHYDLDHILATFEKAARDEFSLLNQDWFWEQLYISENVSVHLSVSACVKSAGCEFTLDLEHDHTDDSELIELARNAVRKINDLRPKVA